ncbi:hypothetical protein KXS11_09250 [Plantibacter flavus]|uniref:hypothetical protein n=1 Tax=Plantibacter flavus TaxID=150123 RepID=UPI003F184021
MQATLHAPSHDTVSPIFTTLARRFESAGSASTAERTPSTGGSDTVASVSAQESPRSPIFEQLAGRASVRVFR